MGRGGGWGRGLGGRQRNWELDAESKFAEGERYCAVLVLNRERADLLGRRAWWSCVSAVAAAALVAVCLAIAWHATVHLAETRGKARVYEAEMRHLRDLSQAAAGLAHETRNPLGLIRGWTQRLADTDLPAQQRHEVASTMIEECDRVTARINQFLTFARPREPTLGPIDLRRLVEELKVILQPDLEARGVALESNIEAAAARVFADADLLRQALFNLLQNAIQFSPRDERIHLSSRLNRDGTVNVDVADHGPGVAAELRPSLFTPYFTTRANGTGLGLAIVRHIARLHGWEVHHEPGSPGGSVFRIRKIHVAAEEHSGR
jgi:signal transduction histidine kinase